MRKPYQKSADTNYESKRKVGHISFNLSNPDEAELYKKWRSMKNASAQAKKWLRSLPAPPAPAVAPDKPASGYLRKLQT